MLYKVANVISGTGQDSASQDEGASLTSVLGTPAKRVELALLVLLCTDAMRTDLLATFDPSKTYESGSSSVPPVSPKPTVSPSLDLISFDTLQEDEATMATERARQEREREIQSTEMQALRRSAITFFDKWRAGVMHRVCDVLCVRGDVVRNAKAKRKADKDAAQKQTQGASLLMDLGGDPFSSSSAPQPKQRCGRYEAVENRLTSFDKPKRDLILHCILLLLLSLETYPAHSRVLLLHLACSLEIEIDVLAEHERSVAQGLLASVASQMDAEEATKKKAADGSASRKWKMGLAAVGGAVLIGVTGGLAAPLLAAGVGTVMGGLGLGATAVSGLLGGLAGSSVLVGSLFGAYGGKMTGRLMKQYAKEVDDFEFIPIQGPACPSKQRSTEWGESEEEDARNPSKQGQHRLRVSIGVSGWLNSTSDVSKPWEVVDASGIEPFALRFELDAMLRVGNSLNDVLFSYAWDGVTYTVVKHTLLGALYAGLWPLGLVKAASILENPFSVAVARAEKAGKVLAQVLISKVQGERPVTLVGYSLGARVIQSCLVELAEQNAFGLVESVVLMGAPVPSDSRSWRKIRSVVAARVVNVYSTEDYILGFLYRTSKLQMGVAGLQEVKDVYGIENVNMSKLVTGHDRYRYLVGTILTKIGFEDVNFEKVEEQSRALELMERKKEQARLRAKEQEKKTAPVPQPVTRMNEEAETLPTRPAPLPARPTESNFQRQLRMQQLRQQTTMRQQPSMGYQSMSGQQPTMGPQPAKAVDLLSDPSPVRNIIPAEIKPSGPEAKSDHNSAFQPSMGCSAMSRQIPVQASSKVGAMVISNPLMDNEGEEDGPIVMRDLDTASSSPSLPRRQPTLILEGVLVQDNMTVKNTLIKKLPPSGEITALETEEEYSEDESELGELCMVDPVPLDDY
ncbi:DUF726-domain-containing protein [Delitschia confertaspora ATCC 74209]|uniref:DUF726-domain-containing protein n=1 Tax=Delitschia confertaspora ATCC 74209 TaxID=1513339 RepID=A0A9P4MYB9_9PLEO|nr:DUF726-domain-containing protein [Delitschia confertaspora ATCC 74209]